MVSSIIKNKSINSYVLIFLSHIIYPNKGSEILQFVKDTNEYIPIVGLLLTTLGGRGDYGLTCLIRAKVKESIKPLEIKIKENKKTLETKIDDSNKMSNYKVI
jgi:hypothetical protein